MRKPIPKSTRQLVRKRDGTKCHYCSKTTTTQNRHLDHIIPVENNGTNDPDNLVVACKQCNTRKGKKPYHQYIQHRLEQVKMEYETLLKRLTTNQ